MDTHSKRLFKKVCQNGFLLSPEEEKIIFTQIRKNTLVIDDYIARLDLIVNKEGHHKRERFVNRIRERLEILMQENDTFREVYWRHFQMVELNRPEFSLF
ncbi:MAG: hypothetical protein HY587_05355 [Candidatus Omnitrophica bacterium]|nr:hypothetical protein [Candidatus Omnitrophota bacterium]